VLVACIELESDAALVRVVRQFVDQTIAEWELDPVREDARLIATELASNAVLHARTEFRLTLRSNGFGFLRIEVRDDNSRMPSPAGTPQDATSGRGLAVVTALAASWGTQRDGDGKVVWAEIGQLAPADDVECLDVSELAPPPSGGGDTPGETASGEAVAF
jgi:anti-sigma regulatory factor (Ser/Thr protein kinase)